MNARDDAAADLLEQMLARPDELLDALGAVFDSDRSEGFDESPQGVASRGMCSLALEHGQAERVALSTASRPVREAHRPQIHSLMPRCFRCGFLEPVSTSRGR